MTPEKPKSRLLKGLPQVSRRQLLKGAGAAAGFAAFPTLLAACGDDEAATTTSTTAAGGGEPSGLVTVGSNASDQLTKDAYGNAFNRFTEVSGIELAINTVDHNTFQQQMNTYLQGQPDDAFTWFAGFRMRFFAEKGLATPFSDVWNDSLNANYSDAFKLASTGNDGEQYFVPFIFYPWAIFYRKSVFADKGYSIPTTLADLKDLAVAMEGDGMIPFAFGNDGNWPAMGTFDYLNLRTNGYQFHVDLMAGLKSWESDEVKQVFATYAELLPYHQPAALARDWQDAARSMALGDSGMYLLGLFMGDALAELDPEILADIDFFAFPEINPDYGQESVEAPIDGFMISKEPENLAGAKAMMAFMGTGEAQEYYTAVNSNWLATANDADISGYTPLQNKALELIGSATNIAQFLDRDTDPGFASEVVGVGLSSFISDPSDVDNILASIEAQKAGYLDT
jgi:multiple sugar transport system substrate-binding protein